jgi:hypothetical protein
VDADEGSMVVILVDGVEVATRSLDGRRVDLGLVDALARLHLSTRLAGGSMVLRRPPPELCELLDLVGLAGVIEGAAGGLPLETVRQPEEPEQVGIEEVLPGGDLPA